jgi:hypothetical protein
MTTLMVWNYQVDHNTEEGYSWVKIPTDYKVGTRAELLFWRVMDVVHGTMSKDFFYSPHEYEVFSGITISEYTEQVDAWNDQHKMALKEFQLTETKTNVTVVSNGRSYSSFFPTEVY